MNKFEKQLEKWNNGILRGAQAKLAKTLKVSTATTALWTTGKRKPSKGYVAQMAELFHMDVYNVLRLFEPRTPTTIYPEPCPQPTAHVLRDRPLENFSYLATKPVSDSEENEQSNSVKLPFLSSVPLLPPPYNEYDVIEWWSVPRRYALGAKYIIRSKSAGMPDAYSEDDLCFIKPVTQYVSEKLTLFLQSDGTFITKRILHKSEAKTSGKAIGIAVRRIKGC